MIIWRRGLKTYLPGWSLIRLAIYCFVIPDPCPAPNDTKTIGRMTCHCFLRPIRRDFTSSSYTARLSIVLVVIVTFDTGLHVGVNGL